MFLPALPGGSPGIGRMNVSYGGGMSLVGGIGTLLVIGVWLYGLFDVVTTVDDECRRLSKAAWLVIVSLLPAIGTIIWLAAGRPEASPDITAALYPPAEELHAAAPGPVGPDDDPDFLRELDRRLRGDD